MSVVIKNRPFCVNFVICCLVALVAIAHANTDEPKRRKPNFIVLFVDDLGYGDLGFTGHPTAKTPNLDRLAWNGKILTTWYSGCNVCSGSRTALMTGRQFPRTGVPGVFGPTGKGGLNLNETTIAEHLKEAGYATGICGKWHLGQRQVYLPGNRGFDFYLGIPYSDDMGDGTTSRCDANANEKNGKVEMNSFYRDIVDQARSDSVPGVWQKDRYERVGLLQGQCQNADVCENLYEGDPAGKILPLMYQEYNSTKVLEQPLDFTTLAQKYNDFILNFIEKQKDNPFFLYVPFSHVHTTSGTQPHMQYAGCNFQGSTARGPFGDALAETDWIVGNIMKKLGSLGLEEDTLVLFTSDNGPWMMRQLSGGSEGLFTGRYAGYWDTGKGSNWEGGIREPAFAYWKGVIPPYSRSAEIVSSLDIFPTLSHLAGFELPNDRAFDGRDATDVLLSEHGKSKHDFLFFYGTCNKKGYSESNYSVTAVRHGKYKAVWCTAPGLGQYSPDLVKRYDVPLMFDVDVDPSESIPLNNPNSKPSNNEDLDALNRILKAHAMEVATFQFGKIIDIPDGPDEGPDMYGVCCDRSRGCNCTSGGESRTGIFNLGTKSHHDTYHAVLGEAEPSPPRTRAQRILQQSLEE